MRRLAAVALAGLAALAVAAPAQPTQKPGTKPTAATAKPGAGSDAQELIFFSKQGPVRVRLQVAVGGKSPLAAWDAFVDAAFKHFDRDGDGGLSAAELAKVPSPAVLFGDSGAPPPGRAMMAPPAPEKMMMAPPPVAPKPDAGPAVRLADLDTDKNGKVSRDEFAAWLLRAGYGPVYARFTAAQPGATKLNDILWKALDRDGDGRLSPEELAGAAESLQKFDEDQDETITTGELLNEPTDRFGRVFAARTSPGPARAPLAEKENPAFLVIPPGEKPAETVKRLLARLDKNHNGKLSREEIGLPEHVFVPFDRDQDDELDAEELEAWVRRPADLTVAVSLGPGTGPQSEQRVRAVAQPGRPLPPLAKAARHAGDNLLQVHLEASVLEVALPPTVLEPPAVGPSLVEQYRKSAPAAGLDRKQIEASPNLAFALPYFDAADRDGNGKLTAAELGAYLDLLSQGANCRVSVAVTELGRVLFDELDLDHDQQLSPREQYAIGRTLAKYAENGFVKREALPVLYRLTVAQGPPAPAAVAGVSAQAGASRTTRPRGSVAGKGPLWFRKMDRNRDGDLTPREFLGPPELFRKLDRDGDGLISLEEAEAYEAERAAAGKSAPPPPGEKKGP